MNPDQPDDSVVAGAARLNIDVASADHSAKDVARFGTVGLVHFGSVNLDEPDLTRPPPRFCGTCVPIVIAEDAGRESACGTGGKDEN